MPLSPSLLRAASLAALLGAALPATAQAPGPPPTVASFGPRPAPPVPGPHSVPGFLDPATGRFTPLASPQAASGGTVSGIVKVIPQFKFDKDFSGSNTVFCTITLLFGGLFHHAFFTVNTASGSVNFAAGDPDQLLPIPYAHDPAVRDMVVETTCYGQDKSGDEHEVSTTSAVVPAPTGDETVTTTDDF